VVIPCCFLFSPQIFFSSDGGRRILDYDSLKLIDILKKEVHTREVTLIRSDRIFRSEFYRPPCLVASPGLGVVLMEGEAFFLTPTP